MANSGNPAEEETELRKVRTEASAMGVKLAEKSIAKVVTGIHPSLPICSTYPGPRHPTGLLPHTPRTYVRS